MDRWTKNLIWWAIGAIIVVLLAIWLVNTLAPVAAADAVEQRHIHYYPRTLSDAGYEVGSSGVQEVREVQMRLFDLGYDVIVDGIPGPGTDAALREFQRDRHLTVTGDLDGRTFKELWSVSRAERGPVDLKCLDCKN